MTAIIIIIIIIITARMTLVRKQIILHTFISYNSCLDNQPCMWYYFTVMNDLIITTSCSGVGNTNIRKKCHLFSPKGNWQSNFCPIQNRLIECVEDLSFKRQTSFWLVCAKKKQAKQKNLINHLFVHSSAYIQLMTSIVMQSSFLKWHRA